MIKPKLVGILMYVSLAFLSCKSPLQNDYSGYIYFKNKPVKGAKIVDLNNNTVYTYTGDNGYFKLKGSDNYNIETIVILHQNKEVDTIQLLRKNGADAMPHTIFRQRKIIDT